MINNNHINFGTTKKIYLDFKHMKELISSCTLQFSTQAPLHVVNYTFTGCCRQCFEFKMENVLLKACIPGSELVLEKKKLEI